MIDHDPKLDVALEALRSVKAENETLRMTSIRKPRSRELEGLSRIVMETETTIADMRAYRNRDESQRADVLDAALKYLQSIINAAKKP